MVASRHAVFLEAVCSSTLQGLASWHAALRQLFLNTANFESPEARRLLQPQKINETALYAPF